MVNYQHGKIYAIRNTINEKIYVGSTAKTYLSNRMTDHRTKARHGVSDRPLYTAMREIGIENFYIELLETFPCSSRDELEAREGHWIRKENTLEPSGYNQIIAGRTAKQHYQDNKERLNEESRRRYAEHKERYNENRKLKRLEDPQKYRQQKRDYNEAHREELNERKKEKIQCECGMEVRKDTITRHRRGAWHTKALQKHQEWEQQQTTTNQP